ncbi:MAG: response regulator [Fibrobacteres bacterium]|nr:response regulator [Fibrobacterota bacterium]
MTESHRLPVLVVDDDRSILAVLQSWLSKAGWIPEVHQDPLKALEAYSLRHHAAVVVDWHMPHLDGLELVGRLRAENQAQTAYVILVTSSEKSDLLDQAFEEGVDDFLRKPLDRQEFVARMKAARRVCLLDKEIRQRSEQDLERRMHAMALQRVSALAGALTHEIRTPLATVKLGVERLAAREAKNPTESHSIVSRLELAVNALAETMEDVLETFGMSHRTNRWGAFQAVQILAGGREFHAGAGAARCGTHFGHRSGCRGNQRPWRCRGRATIGDQPIGQRFAPYRDRIGPAYAHPASRWFHLGGPGYRRRHPSRAVAVVG